jgi:hypothetical protein
VGSPESLQVFILLKPIFPTLFGGEKWVFVMDFAAFTILSSGVVCYSANA